MEQKQTAKRAWLLSFTACVALSLAACGGGGEGGGGARTSFKEGVSAPPDTTQEDRERGWKLVSASGKGAFRYEPEGEASLLEGIFALSTLGSRAPVSLEVYLYKPVTGPFSCQVYYNGKKVKKIGTAIGKLTTIPPKNLSKAGLLTYEIKGPKKKNLPPMQVACGQVVKKELPKKLPSEIPDNLAAIEVTSL